MKRSEKTRREEEGKAVCAAKEKKGSKKKKKAKREKARRSVWQHGVVGEGKGEKRVRSVVEAARK